MRITKTDLIQSLKLYVIEKIWKEVRFQAKLRNRFCHYGELTQKITYHALQSPIKSITTIACDEFIVVTISYDNGKIKNFTLTLYKDEDYHNYLIQKIFKNH